MLGAVDNGSASNSVSLVGFATWLAWIAGVSVRLWTDDEGALGSRDL